jgi:DNA-binding CsgD family transcriptional regulator
MDASERDGCEVASGLHPPHSPVLESIERRILEPTATGLSSGEVADRLGVSVEAVRAALRAIIIKLGARSKLEALIVAIRRGLIDPPPS